MKILIRIFIQKHADRTYTVTAPLIPGISSYGPVLEECKQEMTEALTKHLAEVPAEELHALTLRYDERLVQVTVELRPTGPQGRRRRNAVRFTANLLVRPEDDGQLLVIVPRLTSPPLAFYSSDEEDLAANTQLELAQYFYGESLEEILKYQANRHETIDALEVEFKPKRAVQKVAQAQDQQFMALRATGISLTARAGESGFARAHGREAEVAKILSALAGEQRPSLILTGPSGVGKTAIVYEVVRRIRQKECPEPLVGREVWSVTASSLIAGAMYMGQWQERLANIVAEVRKKRHILFVEDIPGLVDAGRYTGSNLNMAEYLRPYIQDGDVVIIGESTPERLRYAERDNAGFIAQFRTLPVEPAGESLTLSILNAVSQEIERDHKVRITPSAIEAVVELTNRFLPYRAQPGASIRLMQQMTGDYDRRSTGDVPHAVLTRKDVVSTFTRQTGLPEFVLADDIPLDLAAVHRHFADRVVGQEPAVAAIVNLIATIKAGLNDPEKPLGTFLFIGPTGVGKTQMAKTLAKYLFGDERRVIRFDMSEYGDAAGIRRLIGLPGSDQEGELTGKVRSQPFCVLLLDEFEKADPLIYDLFLQVLGEGRLTDVTGVTTSFQNAIILMTSNLGAGAREQRALGLLADDQAGGGRDRAYWQGKVEQNFRAEFVNRIDQIVAFQPLGPETMRMIARRELGDVLLRKGLTRRNVLVNIDNSVIDLLMEQGFSAAFGARPLKRAIEHLVVLPVARYLAAGKKMDSNLLLLTRQDDEVALRVTQMGEDRDRIVRLDEGPLGSGRKQRLADDAGFVEGLADLRIKLQDWAGRDAVLEMRNERDARLAETGEPTFWDDPDAARATLSRFYFLERLLKRLQQLRDQTEYLEELTGLVRRERDTSYRADLSESYTRLARDVAFLEVELLCAHLVHNHKALLVLRPVHTQIKDDEKAGWISRLAAMYLRWANRKGYDIDLVADLVPLTGDQRAAGPPAVPYRYHCVDAGDFNELLRSIARLDEPRELLILLSGTNVYGFLKGEAGYHRRNDQRASGERVQQIASVQVAPWDGLPDAVLEQMLDPATRQKLQDEIQKNSEVIRSYNFGAHREVRDPRTKVHNTDLNAVLEGDLDDFILAYLREVEPATAWEEGDA